MKISVAGSGKGDFFRTERLRFVVSSGARTNRSLNIPWTNQVMNIIQAATELNASPRRVCVAIGFFDGVHLGHQQIIRQTITDARKHEALALIITFDSHPNSVVAPDRVP